MMPCSLCRAILLPQAILSFGTMASLRPYRIWPPSIYLSSFILFLMPPLWACFQTCQSSTRPQAGPLQLSFPLPGYPFHPRSHIKVPPFMELSEEEAVKEESWAWSTLWKRVMWSRAVKGLMGEGAYFQQGANIIQWRKESLFKKWCWNN